MKKRSALVGGVAVAAALSVPAAAQGSSTPGVRMCATPDMFEAYPGPSLGAPTPCDFSSNTTGSEFDPGPVMEIPVVWHVITQTNGSGNVSDQRIINQMAHMNASYAGTLMAQGNDSKIQFVLASTDPQGQPTTGINRVANNTWFGDNGNYAATLSWDSNRYLNVYTLLPFGSTGVIGYVPNLPQGGIVGSTDDGVRMLHTAIDSSVYPHVLSHEVGHHLGLWHTFQNQSCANSNCQTQGDLICDTPPHTFPTQACGSNSGNCGSGVPGNNFMNYQDQACVWEFTPIQIQRMRCTLENWRPDLFNQAGGGWDNYCSSNPNSTGGKALMDASGSTSVAANDLVLEASPLPDTFGLFFYGPTQLAGLPFGNGTRCVGGAPKRMATHAVVSNLLQHAVDVNMPSPTGDPILAGATLNFQAYFRDPAAGGAEFNTSDGLEVVFVP